MDKFAFLKIYLKDSSEMQKIKFKEALCLEYNYQTKSIRADKVNPIYINNSYRKFLP